MAYTLGQICDVLRKHGMPPELVGDAGREVDGVAPIELAGQRELTFVSNPKYAKALETTRAAAVIVGSDLPAPPHLQLIRVPDPYAAITAAIITIHGYRKHRAAEPAGAASISPSARIGTGATIHPGVTIDDDVVIGEQAVIYPGCYIGPRSRIGARVLLFPNVVIYDDTVIGDRVTIHANSVIGEDGLGYAPLAGRWLKIPQIGNVVIEDDVEIGAGCAIDRATLGSTRIGAGTKFSNLIAVGHGTQIGPHCMLVAQVGLAGSVKVGEHVTIAGQAGIVGHIRIGDRATVGAKAGVTNDVPDGETVLGQPAVPITEAKRRVLGVIQIPRIREQLREMERELRSLRAEVAALRSGPAAGPPGAT